MIIITYYYKIIITCYYIIITSLLRHYYVIITSLFQMAKTGNNEPIITHYAFSVFPLLHCYYPLLPLLPIITCYQLGNLQMSRQTHDRVQHLSTISVENERPFLLDSLCLR